MAFVLGDRVRETTTTVGTGDITLGGAFVGFQSFAVGIGDNNSTYYAIANLSGSEWEVGIGTYSLSSNTLTRDAVLSSSNADALVPFGAGTKDVICTMPAERSVFVVNGEVVAPGAVVPNSLLEGADITLGSTTIPLGGTAATLSNLTLISPTITLLNLTDAVIANSLINATPVGNSSPSTGAFTTLTSSSTTTLNGTTIPASATLATTNTAQTLLNKTLQSPRITNGILDANGNDLFLLTATASAVNSLTYANAAAGGSPSFTADGADGDISINFIPRGTGTLQQSGVPVVTTTGVQTLTNKSISASQITGSLPFSQVSGTVPVAQGGTGSVTSDAARVALGVETSTTGATRLASGTNAQRDGVPQAGYFRFNTDTDAFEGYDGSTWVSVTGDASGTITVGTTAIPLGGSSTTLAGLTSVTTEAAVITTRATNAPSADNDLSFDMAVRNNFTCTPSGSGTLTFTNITAGQSGFILLDNSGGHTISAAATTKVSSGFLTAVSTAGVYLLSYFSNGTNVYVVSSGALA